MSFEYTRPETDSDYLLKTSFARFTQRLRDLGYKTMYMGSTTLSGSCYLTKPDEIAAFPFSYVEQFTPCEGIGGRYWMAKGRLVTYGSGILSPEIDSATRKYQILNSGMVFYAWFDSDGAPVTGEYTSWDIVDQSDYKYVRPEVEANAPVAKCELEGVGAIVADFGEYILKNWTLQPPKVAIVKGLRERWYVEFENYLMKWREEQRLKKEPADEGVGSDQ